MVVAATVAQTTRPTAVVIVAVPVAMTPTKVAKVRPNLYEGKPHWLVIKGQ